MADRIDRHQQRLDCPWSEDKAASMQNPRQERSTLQSAGRSPPSPIRSRPIASNLCKTARLIYDYYTKASARASRAC